MTSHGRKLDGVGGWARKIGVVVGLTLLGRLLGFLFPVLIFRSVPAAAAGLVYFFVNSAYFVVQPVSGGPAMAAVRAIAAAKTESEEAEWLRAALFALLPAVGLAAVIAAVVAATASAPVVPMLVMVVGLSVDAMYFQILTARRHYQAAATYRLLANAAQLVVLSATLALGIHSVTILVSEFAMSSVLGCAVVETRMRTIEVLRRPARSTRTQRLHLLRVSVPSIVAGVAYSCLTGLDTYLVRLGASRDVAVYGAAKSMAAPALLVAVAVASIAQPEAARADSSEAAALRARIIRIGGGAIVAAAVVSWSCAGIAATIVFGHRYPNAPDTLRWLGIGTAALGVYSLLQVWCFGRGRYREPMVALGAGAVVAVTLNLELVPRIGAEGAGIAYCSGACLAVSILAITSGRGWGVFPAEGDRASSSERVRARTRLAPGIGGEGGR